VKFQAFGKDIEEMFENSALALKKTIAPKIKVKNKIKKQFRVEGKDNEAFLYNFLEEFLFLLDAENFLLNKVKVRLVKSKKLEVEVWGDKASNYKFTNDVKAVTYNEMFVKNAQKSKISGATKSKTAPSRRKQQDFVGKKNKWIAQVVLDV